MPRQGAETFPTFLFKRQEIIEIKTLRWGAHHLAGKYWGEKKTQLNGVKILYEWNKWVVMRYHYFSFIYYKHS